MMPRPRPLLLVLSIVLALAGLIAAPGAARADDTTAPTLTSFSVSPASVSPGSTITVSYATTDDTGVQLVSFRYRTPSGGEVTFEKRADEGAIAASGTITSSVPESWRNGQYLLTKVVLADTSGHITEYRADHTVAVSPTGTAGPTSNPFDFSTATITMSGSDADFDTPSVLSYSLAAPALVTAGGRVKIDYEVGDASPVADLAFRFTTGSDFRTFQVTDQGGIPTPGTLTGTVTTEWPSGTYHLVSISVTDAVGNAALYNADGSISKTSGSDGPTTHDLDFSRTSFRVAQKPGRIGQPAVKVVGRSAKVGWKAPAANGSPITKYVVKVTGKRRANLTAKKAPVVLRNLKPGRYAVTVTAVNGVGSGQASTSRSFTVKKKK